MLIIYTVLIVFVAFPGILVLIRNLLADTYLWQVKEYRIDRIRIHYQNNEQTEKVRNKVYSIIKYALLVSLIIYFKSPSAAALLLSTIVAYIIYILEAELFIKQILKKKFSRPSIKSPRNILILGFSFVTILLPFLLFVLWLSSLPIQNNLDINGFLEFKESEVDWRGTDIKAFLPEVDEDNNIVTVPLETILVSVSTLIILSLDLTSPFIVATYSLVTEPLAQMRRRRMISAAKQKLQNNKKVKVIGITGSYGKTTTKEILAQLLEQKFKVVKTEKNNNTDVGIAQTILRSLREDTELLIAEMAAYKKGEIKNSVSIAQPDIAIVTGVEGQHLALFGSIENLFLAKYEIVDGLKKDGVAILNGDNEYCIRMAERTNRRKVIYFSVDDKVRLATPEIDTEDSIDEDTKLEFPEDLNLYAAGVLVIESGIEFDLRISDESWHVKTNIPGEHNATNLLAVIATAMQLGLGIKEIVGIINNTRFEVPYLGIESALNESRIIDDGYNSSPMGFRSALTFLKNTKADNDKWVITQGILELGEEKEKEYKSIAKNIVNSNASLITTDKTLAKIFEKQSKDKQKVILVDSVFDIKKEYVNNIKKGDLVLLEGTIPQIVLNAITDAK